MANEVVALAKGDLVWFVPAGNPPDFRVRPARIASDGIIETIRGGIGPDNQRFDKQFATIDVGTLDPKHVLLLREHRNGKWGELPLSEKQLQEVTAFWSPYGDPRSWHLIQDVAVVSAYRLKVGLPPLVYPETEQVAAQAPQDPTPALTAGGKK
jgi:hypothetical protein